MELSLAAVRVCVKACDVEEYVFALLLSRYFTLDTIKTLLTQA